MDRFGETYYPIAVGIYNDRNMLGYFDPGLYELGFHERLMYASEKQLHDIVRHELASLSSIYWRGTGYCSWD